MTTHARRACAISSARSGTCSATSRCESPKAACKRRKSGPMISLPFSGRASSRPKSRCAPACRTPKDGPSAGVAMFVALASLLAGRPVRSDVAMTGEISLRGLVLAIGGVKEKVLAALRAGISTVMLPERNRRDLEDIPADARDSLKFVWIEQVDEAIATALSPATPEVVPV